MKGGEAYELAGPGPDRLLGDRRPARIHIHRAARDGAEVRCIADGAPFPCPMASEHDWWAFVSLNDGRAPAGWRLTGLASPNSRMWDGREVWSIPGPPWGGVLCWAGPGHPLIQHGEGPRPGWLGPELDPVTSPCPTLAAAQAAADAWWLSQVADHVTRGQPNGQQSLFSEAAS